MEQKKKKEADFIVDRSHLTITIPQQGAVVIVRLGRCAAETASSPDVQQYREAGRETLRIK